MDRIQRLILMTLSKLTLHHVNLSSLVVAAITQVLRHNRRVMGLLQTPRKFDCLLDGTKWHNIEFSSESRGRLQAQNVLTESEGLTLYANCMLDSPLSSFELLVDNSMLTHIQQCREAETHRVKNSDEWKLTLSEVEALISLPYVRGALCGINRPILEFWEKIREYLFCRNYG